MGTGADMKSLVEEVREVGPGKGDQLYSGSSLDSRGGYHRYCETTKPCEGSDVGIPATLQETYQRGICKTCWR